MSLAFRERLASDPFFSVRITEPEKLCPYSDQILDEEDPDSVDRDSKIKTMNTEEFHQHVREAQERQKQDEVIERLKKMMKKKKVKPEEVTVGA